MVVAATCFSSAGSGALVNFLLGIDPKQKGQVNKEMASEDQCFEMAQSESRSKSYWKVVEWLGKGCTHF